MGRAQPAAIALVFAAAAASIAGCGADTYPMHGGPAGGSMYAPAALGQPIPGVVLFLRIRPGDLIELLSAEPVGVADGATVEFFFSPPIIGADGSHVVGDKLEPLVGAVAVAAEPSDGPGNTVGVVAQITATKPGRYTLTGVRLRYRLNGAAAQFDQGIDVTMTVCADDPKPADCNEPTDVP
jgi:hypothetical protein